MKTVRINDAARIKGISRQAINAAIARGDLVMVEVETTRKEVTAASLAQFQPNLTRQACGRKKKQIKA